jgi:hypothetical protein
MRMDSVVKGQKKKNTKMKGIEEEESISEGKEEEMIQK